MATNDILAFCPTDTGSNLISQPDYITDPQLDIGNQPGVARLKLVNKALRQATYIAAALSQFISDQTGDDVLDNNNQSLVLASLFKTINPPEFDAGSSGTAKTLNLSKFPAQKLVMNGNCTLTLTNPASGTAYVFKLVQDATGSRTMTWPVNVKWSNNIPPDLTPDPTKTDLINLYYDGVNYYGSYALNF